MKIILLAIMGLLPTTCYYGQVGHVVDGRPANIDLGDNQRAIINLEGAQEGDEVTIIVIRH